MLTFMMTSDVIRMKPRGCPDFGHRQGMSRHLWFHNTVRKPSATRTQELRWQVPTHPIPAARECRAGDYAVARLDCRPIDRYFLETWFPNPLAPARNPKRTQHPTLRTNMGCTMSKPGSQSVQSRQAEPRCQHLANPPLALRPPAETRTPVATAQLSSTASQALDVTRRSLAPAPAKNQPPEVMTRLPASRIERRFLLAFLLETFGKGAYTVNLRNDWYIIVAPRQLTTVSVLDKVVVLGRNWLALASYQLNADIFEHLREKGTSSSTATPTDNGHAVVVSILMSPLFHCGWLCRRPG